MVEFRTVEIRNHGFDFGPVTFLRAELSVKRSPFAVVHYAYKGREQKYGLRLDLHKLVFLDHPVDIAPETVDRAARKIACYLKSKT